MKKIVIIGSNGVLGSDLAINLSSKYEIIPINRDSYEKNKSLSCDVLINVNGNSKRFWANENVLEDFEASATSVYKTILDFKFDKYIYVSSSDVYENHTSPKFTFEDKKIEKLNLSPYGFHKCLGESIIKNYVKNYVILRSSMILGSKLRKGPIYDLINNKDLFVSKGSRFQMITTGEISNIISHFIKEKSKTGTFNMGGHGAVVLDDIEKILGMKASFSSKTQKQIYEMSVVKLSKYYALKKSEQYLKEFVSNLKK